MKADFTNGRRTIQQIANKIFLFPPPGDFISSPLFAGALGVRRVAACPSADRLGAFACTCAVSSVCATLPPTVRPLLRKQPRL